MKVPKKWFVLWFTGLPCSGKTTLADAVAEELKKMWYINIQRLDGDEIRTHLCSDLWFSREDRTKNLERVGYVAKLLSDNWVGVIASFVSPYRSDRDKIRAMVTNYIEVFVDTPLEICEERDVKGMYAKARAGIIKDFTGVDDPYERPENTEVQIYTIEKNISQNCSEIINKLLKVL
jgi:adenylylsulfate kinase